MNPPTDVGKKDLPPGLRNRFTEYYVDELSNKEDLITVVLAYLQRIGPSAQEKAKNIVDFYLEAKKLATNNLAGNNGTLSFLSFFLISIFSFASILKTERTTSRTSVSARCVEHWNTSN
jgi:hypothetical protein